MSNQSDSARLATAKPAEVSCCSLSEGVFALKPTELKSSADTHDRTLRSVFIAGRLPPKRNLRAPPQTNHSAYPLSTLAVRHQLIAIADKDVGQTETSRNHGPAIPKFWTATSYPEGYENREPYCAAAVCYWVCEWLKIPAVQQAFGKTDEQLEQWRCKSASAFGWRDWAKEHGVRILSDSPSEILHTGDIVVFGFSHVGIVYDDKGDRIYTIEANTGATGGRDGDGIFRKDRPREVARCFIRLLLHSPAASFACWSEIDPAKRQSPCQKCPVLC